MGVVKHILNREGITQVSVTCGGGQARDSLPALRALRRTWERARRMHRWAGVRPTGQDWLCAGGTDPGSETASVWGWT